MNQNRARMAPEAEAGMLINEKSDIWSLGQLAYQLLSPLPTGQVTERYLVEGQPVYWVEAVSDELKNLIIMMVSSDPAARPDI